MMSRKSEARGCICRGESDNSVIVRVHVQPRSAKNSCSGIYGQAIKLKITAPPVDGKANAMAAKILAKIFKVPKADVLLLSGSRSRGKRFRISGVDIKKAEKLLAQAG